MSYVLIASTLMLNVVVAILLDEFIATVTREKEAEQAVEEFERNRRKLKGCLDAITHECITFEDSHDLDVKIDSIYEKLDDDGDGGLTFDEFRNGLLDNHKIHFTRDDFEVPDLVCIVGIVYLLRLLRASQL